MSFYTASRALLESTVPTIIPASLKAARRHIRDSGESTQGTSRAQFVIGLESGGEIIAYLFMGPDKEDPHALQILRIVPLDDISPAGKVALLKSAREGARDLGYRRLSIVGTEGVSSDDLRRAGFVVGDEGAEWSRRGRDTPPKLRIEPASLATANAYVSQYHRHHKPSRGHKFSLALRDTASGEVVGVAIASRPRARMIDDGRTLEVVRVCTWGEASNGCSKLLGAVRRIAKSQGYSRVVTYTLPEEGGASLRGAGFEQDLRSPGGSWSRPSRKRTDPNPTSPKLRWVSRL